MENGPQEKSFVHKYKFSWDVELPLLMDFKFLYLWNDLFYVYLWNLLLTLAKWIAIVSHWLIWNYLTECYKPFWYLLKTLPKPFDF